MFATMRNRTLQSAWRLEVPQHDDDVRTRQMCKRSSNAHRQALPAKARQALRGMRQALPARRRDKRAQRALGSTGKAITAQDKKAMRTGRRVPPGTPGGWAKQD